MAATSAETKQQQKKNGTSMRRMFSLSSFRNSSHSLSKTERDMTNHSSFHGEEFFDFDISDDDFNKSAPFEVALDEIAGEYTVSKLTNRRRLPVLRLADLHVTSTLGTGTFARVYQVQISTTVDSASLTNGLTTETYYAMKTLNPIMSHDKEAASDLANEANILNSVGRHNNIIRLYGIVSSGLGNPTSTIDATPIVGCSLLMEVVECTLQDKLNGWRSATKRFNPFYTARQKASDLKFRIKDIIMGIVKGMQYLHSKDVALRDLKPHNVGIDQYGTVKLLDFGFAREMYNWNRKDDHAGTLRYMAPETALAQSNQALKVDVYSFGLLLWEVCTLQKPYHEYADCASVFQQAVFVSHSRPSTKSIPCKDLRELIKQCWDPNPDTRPNFSQIGIILSKVFTHQRKHLSFHKQYHSVHTKGTMRKSISEPS